MQNVADLSNKMQMNLESMRFLFHQYHYNWILMIDIPGLDCFLSLSLSQGSKPDTVSGVSDTIDTNETYETEVAKEWRR